MPISAVELLDTGAAILHFDMEKTIRPLLLREPEKVLLVDRIKIDKAADNGLRLILDHDGLTFTLDVTGHYAIWERT